MTGGAGGETDGQGPTDASGLLTRLRLATGRAILVAVFSQVRVPADKFGLERLFATTGHARLHFNQPQNRWYRGAEAAIDAAIGDALKTSGADELILYGSSMGAFGALRTAPRWPEARVFAFAPDFAVGEAGSRSAEAGLSPLAGEPDLAALLAPPRRGRIEIAAGLFDPYDASVAARLAGLKAPALRLIPLASSHELHDHLYSVNVIRKLIGGFRRDLAAEAAARNLLVEVADWTPYRQFAQAAADFGAGRPVSEAALALSGNPGVERLRAEAALAAGDPGRAIDILEKLQRTIAASPALASLPKRYLKTIPRRLIALLREAGRREAAAAVAAEAARAFPNDAGFAAAARPD